MSYLQIQDGNILNIQIIMAKEKFCIHLIVTNYDNLFWYAII